MDKTIFEKLTQKYPFITLCVYANQEYVGIVQNRDSSITTIYEFGAIVDHQEKLLYLELASQWWWESNHSIPINIFLKEDWQRFRYTLRTFNNRDLEILHGPTCSMLDMVRKKGKRRSITLVRRID